jgi:hypothetical protein
MDLDWLKVGEREYLKKQQLRETVEDIGGEFGFRVVWMVQDYWANVWVWEIVAHDDQRNPYFETFDENGNQNFVQAIQEAKEWYLNGFVKGDGCSQFDMGYQHLCGARSYQKHIALLEYIWKRAFELMGRDPEREWGETHYMDKLSN